MFKKILILMMILSPLVLCSTELSLSYFTTKYNYAEKQANSIKDTEESNFGEINGLEAGYSTLSHDCDNAGFTHKFAYSEGHTDYVGSFWGGQYGDLLSKTHNRIAEYSLDGGVVRYLNNDFAIGGSLGFGILDWRRSIYGGSEERYVLKYISIGGSAEYWVNSNVIVGVAVMHKRAFDPKMLSTQSGYTYALGDTFAWKYSIPVRYKINKKLTALIEYTFNNWDIGKSDVKPGGTFEPDSRTRNQIIKAGVAYKF